MKRRISTSALSLMAGGIITAMSAWASPIDTETAYLSVFFTNSTQVYYVDSVPLPTNGIVSPITVSVYTDGSGKIDGVANFQVSLKNDADVVEGVADITADINGSIVTKGTSIKVMMTLSGSGYSTDGTLNGKTFLNLRFNGTMAPDTSAIVGELNGKLVPGLATINNGKVILVRNEPATLAYSSDRFDFQGKTMRVGKSITSTGGMCGYYYPYLATGLVNLNKETFKATLKGVAQGVGARVTVTGTTQAVPSSNAPDASNIIIPEKASATGKIAGQKVTASGARVLYWGD